MLQFREGSCLEHGDQDALVEDVSAFSPVECPVDGCTHLLVEHSMPSPDPFRPYYVKSQGLWINSKDEERAFETRAEASGSVVISRNDSAKREWRDNLREGVERDARAAGYRDYASMAQDLRKNQRSRR